MLSPRVAPPDVNDYVEVFNWLLRVFRYEPDLERLGELDNWPTRAEVATQLWTGVLRGDCDDFAFAAAYALHDLGAGARVVITTVETGACHMVAETADGWVLDCRQRAPATWDELEALGYRSQQMNDLHFEDRPPRWVSIRVDADGRREYAP